MHSMIIYLRNRFLIFPTQILGPCFKHHANVFKFLWRTKYVDWATKKINREQNYFAKKTYNNKGKSILIKS